MGRSPIFLIILVVMGWFLLMYPSATSVHYGGIAFIFGVVLFVTGFGGATGRYLAVIIMLGGFLYPLLLGGIWLFVAGAALVVLSRGQRLGTATGLTLVGFALLVGVLHYQQLI